MAVGSIWLWWSYADTQGNSGWAGNSVVASIPPKSIFAWAALNDFFINSSGGQAFARIDTYQTRDPNTGVDSPQIPVYGPVLFGDNVVSVTFTVLCYAQQAGTFFSNGANANGTFMIGAWDA
jgi:hypothetical protein